MHFSLPAPQFLSPSQMVLTLWWQGASLGAGTATWTGQSKGAAPFSSLLSPRTLRSLSEITAIRAGTSAGRGQDSRHETFTPPHSSKNKQNISFNQSQKYVRKSSNKQKMLAGTQWISIHSIIFLSHQRGRCFPKGARVTR